MNKDGSKKLRGSNYTPTEQTMLLELIKKHIEIIENKETNAVISSNKRTTWNEIARRYNAMAVTGPRSWIQLRNLYENLKQRRKRKICKESTKNSPERSKTRGTMERKNAHLLYLPTFQRQQLYIKNINDLNKKASSDMKQICTAGGACNTSVLAESDRQIQAMVSPKTEPLQFGIELTISGDDMESITVPAQPPFIVKNEIEEDSISAAGSSKEFPSDISKIKHPDDETCGSSTKEEYYKLKLRNAKLERKFLIQRHKMEREKHTLQLEILNLKRQKLL